MNNLIFLLSLLLCAPLVSAQANPFGSIGKEADVLTLSKGKYTEIHGNDSLQRIGSVIVNMNTGTIYELLDEDTLYSEATLDPTIISRWYSPDPLAAKYPMHSPYNFVANNPVLFKDPDGRDWIITTKFENGVKHVSLHLKGAVINGSSNSDYDMGLFQQQVKEGLVNYYAGIYPVDGATKESDYSEIHVIVTTDLRVINDVKDIQKDDHIFVATESGHPMTPDNTSSGQVNRFGGRVMYINQDEEDIARTAAHEGGHTLDLRHIDAKREWFLGGINPDYNSEWDKKRGETVLEHIDRVDRASANNLMFSQSGGKNLSTGQVETIIDNHEKNRINKGSNKPQDIKPGRSKYESSTTRSGSFCSTCDE